MISTAVVLAYLAAALYIGIFAFRRSRRSNAEDYFVAGRSLGPGVFLLSLFGANMTAFSILGASGHAFSNGIVTFGLMASSSALVIPICLFTIGTRLWTLGKRHGFITPVQMFRDRWECGHIGTVIFVVQALLLVPYVIIAVMGGGTTLSVVSNGLVPFWVGGAIVSLVVMGYVFFGGMRGTAWVNAFQTVLFLVFGTIATVVIAQGMGGFGSAVDALLASPSTAPLLTRERVSPAYFFSYTFIPLSSIAFPHIGIFCMTARRLGHFKKTIVLYPICMLAIWLPSVFLGVMANRATDVPAIAQKLTARAALAAPAAPLQPEARARSSNRPAATTSSSNWSTATRQSGSPRCSRRPSWPPSWRATRRSSRCRRCSRRTSSPTTAAGDASVSGCWCRPVARSSSFSLWWPTPSPSARRPRSSTSPRSTRSPAMPPSLPCSSRPCSGRAARSGARSRVHSGRQRP